MNREEIYQKIVESADRFGAGNPQQFKLFGSQLAKCSHEEIFWALIAVFTSAHPAEKLFQRQELAGRLLAKMKPSYRFALESTIRNTLPNYNLSIEQLPKHFVAIYGLPTVIAALQKIETESLPDRDLASLRTMRWWLTGAKE